MLFRSEMLRLVPLHDVWTNFGLREFSDTAAEKILLVGKREVHRFNYIPDALALPTTITARRESRPDQDQLPAASVINDDPEATRVVRQDIVVDAEIQPATRAQPHRAGFVADEEHVVTDLANQGRGISIPHRAVRIGR